MTTQELKKLYLDFFISKGHKVLPNVSLLPENDPTALFISAGMHPLVPYLLGEEHPLGKRLTSVQRCLRTDDIDEVGDKVHQTFFEMLGNWSLGDPAGGQGGPASPSQGGYWKKEALEWSFEFLTSGEWLKIPREKLAVSVFAGDQDAPFDQESYDIWLGLGISPTRIAKLPKKNNWWGPAGQTGPCGPDSEIFVWTGEAPAPEDFDSSNPLWVEVWNDVFMQCNKKADGTFEPLKQKNVDTGMGLERTVAILNGYEDNYQIDALRTVVQKIEQISGKSYDEELNKKPMKVIADHLRAATFLIADGVLPSNVEQGYILRRLIRRAVRFGRLLGILKPFTQEVALTVIATMRADYPYLDEREADILQVLVNEEEKFRKALERGLKEIEKYEKLDGKIAFYLYETYGFPLEMSEEIALERGQNVDKQAFAEEFKKHQEISRQGASKKFAGGLADHSKDVTKLHTATHLLNAALRAVLGTHVHQMGSNITSERLRFDFPNPEKLTDEQRQKVENLVNQKIEENLPIQMETMTLDEAKRKGAQAVFVGKYSEEVKVYSVGNFSMEVCGGPHVDFTGTLGKFKIIKEEAAGAGIRRLYATLK